MVSNRALRRSSGFTLVEIIVTISVLSIALLAMVQAWQISAQNSATSIVQAKSAYLAELYLEEINNRRFDEYTAQGGSPRCTASSGSDGCSGYQSGTVLGPDAAETDIGDYDDVDDFHNQTFTSAGLHGASSAYRGYSVRVVVDYQGGSFFSSGHLVKRVRVYVTPPGGSAGSPYAAFRGNY